MNLATLRTIVALVLLGVFGCRAPMPASIKPAATGDVEPFDAASLGSLAGWVEEQRGSTWFLVLPYWTPAYGIVIGQTEPKTAMEPPEWFAELYLASRSARQVGRTPPIESWGRTRLALDPSTALSVAAASEAIVRRARYPKPDIHLDEHGNRVETVTGNADGTAYYFGTWRFKAFANTPRAGFARDLVVLSDRLRKIAEAKAEERAVLLAECVEFANDLRSRAEDAPW